MGHTLFDNPSPFFPERAGETRGALHHGPEGGHQNSEPRKAFRVCAHEGTRCHVLHLKGFSLLFELENCKTFSGLQ